MYDVEMKWTVQRNVKLMMTNLFRNSIFLGVRETKSKTFFFFFHSFSCSRLCFHCVLGQFVFVDFCMLITLCIPSEKKDQLGKNIIHSLAGCTHCLNQLLWMHMQHVVNARAIASLFDEFVSLIKFVFKTTEINCENRSSETKRCMNCCSFFFCYLFKVTKHNNGLWL